MIRIIKPPQAPAILTTEGTTKRAEHCAAYQANSPIYQTRRGKFGFDAAIYAHPTVKSALEIAQHKKCCYCETFVGREGEVEHFRPKSACQQAKGSPFIRPGYYWLAYDWDNLFLACHSCNALYKRNLFPLENPSQRALNHNENCATETPLFVHPVDDNPENFISFRQEIPFPLHPRGKRTITSLRLDRESLNEARRTRLSELSVLKHLLSIEHQLPKDAATLQLLNNARQLLAQCTNDEATFAAMARANGF